MFSIKYKKRSQKCVDIGMEKCAEGYRYGNEIIEEIYLKRASKPEWSKKFIETYEAIEAIKERTKFLNKRFQDRINQCEASGASMDKGKGIFFGDYNISFNAIFNYQDEVWDQQLSEAKKNLIALKIVN